MFKSLDLLLMSGHSKWAQIKHKKGAADAKKGRLFSQLSRTITLAAKCGAKDQGMNAALRDAVEKARQANMPASNINRAIARAGEKDASTLEEVCYEAYGPGGVALLIECITDNSNRTSNELKHILQKHGGKFAEPGAVSWMFAKRAIFIVPAAARTETLELALIDAGAEEIETEEQDMRITAPPESSSRVAEVLRAALGKDCAPLIGWVPQTIVSLSADQQNAITKLYEALHEHGDVQEMYSNER